MIFQINADHHLSVSPEYAQKIEGLVTTEIDRFLEQLTRIEIHLSDQNADKENGSDKRCNIEARVKGKPPIAVSDDAATYDLAITGAALKLKSTLDTLIHKTRGH